MVVRAVLILVLFVLPAVRVACAGGAGACEPAPCCCGPQSCGVEIVCGCAADESERPTAPRPAPEDSPTLLLLLAVAGPVLVLDGGAAGRTAPRDPAPRAVTGNEKQALLCVWRT